MQTHQTSTGVMVTMKHRCFVHRVGVISFALESFSHGMISMSMREVYIGTKLIMIWLMVNIEMKSINLL